MIEHIFAAEFDNIQGAVVRYVHPPISYLGNEGILASYMIPDGGHKREKDITYFRLDLSVQATNEATDSLRHEFNARQTTVYFYNNEKYWAPICDKENKKIEFTMTLFKDIIHFKAEKNEKIIEIEAKNIKEYKIIFEGFISVTVDGKTYGIQFKDPKNLNLMEYFLSIVKCQHLGNKQEEKSIQRRFYFHNQINIKRDQSLQRGALIRSIAVCSSSMNIFHPLEEIISDYADAFMDLPINLDEKALDTLRVVLTNALQKLNNQVREMPLSMVYMSPDEMNYVNISSIVKDPLTKMLHFNLETSLASASLLKFVSLFQEKTMVIYNAILRGARILFVSNESSCEEICSCVVACIHLVSPLNIVSKVYPFEHLLNTSFLESEGYIAGVSNPIFRTRKNWWDVCCDVQDGTVVDQSLSAKMNKGEELGEAKLQQIDQEFIQEILKKIKDKEITESQLRKYFYEYTKNMIDYFMNSSNMIDYAREDKALMEAFDNKSNKWKKTHSFEIYQNYLLRSREVFKVVFADKFLDVNTALTNFVEKKAFNDFDLLKDYSVLVDVLADPYKMEVFLKYLLSRKTDLTVLSAGMISANEEIQNKTAQLFMLFESHHYGKNIMSFFSYYTLFIYEGLKYKFQNGENTP